MYTELEIIRGCQKGNKLYQYELVKRYSGMLLTVCRRYVADNSMAKDVLQNTFIKIFRHIDKYQKTGSFEAWMRTIAIRCSLDWIGKKYFKSEMSTDEMPDLQSFEPSILGRLNVEEILQLVQSLSPSLRSVFNLNIIEGYNHKEIASMLGISESTSRTNLMRARQMIQQKMEHSYFKKNKRA